MAAGARVVCDDEQGRPATAWRVLPRVDEGHLRRCGRLLPLLLPPPPATAELATTWRRGVRYAGVRRPRAAAAPSPQRQVTVIPADAGRQRVALAEGGGGARPAHAMRAGPRPSAASRRDAASAGPAVEPPRPRHRAAGRGARKWRPDPRRRRRGPAQRRPPRRAVRPARPQPTPPASGAGRQRPEAPGREELAGMAVPWRHAAVGESTAFRLVARRRAGPRRVRVVAGLQPPPPVSLVSLDLAAASEQPPTSCRSRPALVPQGTTARTKAARRHPGRDLGWHGAPPRRGQDDRPPGSAGWSPRPAAHRWPASRAYSRSAGPSRQEKRKGLAPTASGSGRRLPGLPRGGSGALHPKALVARCATLQRQLRDSATAPSPAAALGAVNGGGHGRRAPEGRHTDAHRPGRRLDAQATCSVDAEKGQTQAEVQRDHGGDPRGGKMSDG